MGQQVAKALAASETIEWRGTTYTMAPMGMQKVKKDFQKWAESRALVSAIELGKDLMKAGLKDDAARLFDDTRKDINAGLFGFGGSQWLQTVSTFEGQIQLIYVMVRENHPEFTLEMAQEMGMEKLDEVLAKLHLEADDPNSPAPTK